MLYHFFAPLWCVGGQVSALSRAYGGRTILAFLKETALYGVLLMLAPILL